MQMSHETVNLTRILRHNRWALGYIAAVVTLGLLLMIFERI